jgi:hypothetical protein
MAKNKDIKLCFYCNEPMGEEHPSIIGIDVPYINLPFHRDCFKKVYVYGDQKYLHENKEKIFKWAKENK